MSRHVESVITEHHAVIPAEDGEVLCGTAVVAGHSFALELPPGGAVELGRGPDADVQLVSAGVSRAHARLALSGDRATIEDLGSRNGTFVNRQRVERKTAVGAGDEIAIGDARFTLLRRAALPAGVAPMMVRRALLYRLNYDVAVGERPCVFVLQLPERWYEIPQVRELLVKLSGTVYFGLFDDHVVAFAVKAPEAEARALHASTTRALRLAGVEVSSGFDAEPTGDGEAILHGALHALLTAQDEDDLAGDEAGVADPAMRALHEEARRVAASAAPVLLAGEAGVAKEALARAIHRASGRSGPLVCVNTAALPEQLLDVALFGHERGAFSGAAHAKPGLVEAAHGGTLFFDEIGELPPGTQAKLLRVLEEGAARRVGGTHERHVDVRVVAATSVELEQAVAESRFRQDLLLRLGACTLAIPPLRERRADIPAIAEALLARAAAALGAPQLRFTPDALAALERHAWPGNERELRGAVERAAALSARTGGPIGPELLADALRPSPRTTAIPPAASASASPPEPVRDEVREFEKQRIVDALQKTNGNQTQAAELLGLPRRTLAYKMTRLGIKAK